jgi:uncharacterized protein (DUF2384 family)
MPSRADLSRVSMVAAMPANTQLDGTIQLPDGRTIPVVITVDLAQVEYARVEAADPLLLRAVEVFGRADKAIGWLNSANHELGGRTPREVASTTEGRDQVLGILVGLERGFPA